MLFKLIDVPVFFFAAVLFAYCFVKTLQPYRQKRKKTAFSLLVLFAGCVVINICSALDGLLFLVIYDVRYGYAISLIFTAIGIIGLIYFATEIFASESTRKPIQMARLAFSIGIGAIAVWGTLSLLSGQSGQTSPPLIVLFMASLTIYIIIGVQAYKLAKRIEDAYYKKSISFIGHFALGNLGIYIFFILDSLVPGLEGTTVWSFIGVCIFAFTAYLAYVGFVKPMAAR